MAASKQVSREDVMSALAKELRPLRFVRALWEGGAPGYGRLDEWSDIDAYVLVDEGAAGRTFAAVEKALKRLSDIQQKYDISETPWPGVYQAFYRLKDASKYLILDLAVVTTSSAETFLEAETHGEALFRFNKEGAAKPKPFDRRGIESRARKRLERLEARFDMFECFVQKEINRRNWIEAVDLYRAIVLDSLTEVLRLKHNAIHHEFRTRYIYHEIPARDAARLERLYFVADQRDLERKLASSSRWFRSVVAELRRTGIKLRGS